MKKKYIAGILVAVLFVAAAMVIYKKMYVEINKDENGKSISIIGGADGPTAVFMAGKLGESDQVIEYKSISMEEAKEVFAQEGSYVILDVRRADEYEEGHIPGALNIPNEEIAGNELEELPDKDQTIYVYCRSGRRSKDAATKLVALGYTSVIECGGILDWTGDVE